jgi:hypothetical protein
MGTMPDLMALIAAWETERDERHKFRSTLALDSNRLYQEGFADGLNHAIHTLKVAAAVANAEAQD